ncbi:hypothetical protein CEXT_421161 [Caerostris extrusa]|uniref:Uncharacterized protein n=1 Tax=Caerostris extrusa TaxID=172846 RepID=A0AAV4MIR5_CAEEX|nr:hypothetical protein CEXT_421161 [Caerostris extrusa]
MLQEPIEGSVSILYGFKETFFLYDLSNVAASIPTPPSNPFFPSPIGGIFSYHDVYVPQFIAPHPPMAILVGFIYHMNNRNVIDSEVVKEFWSFIPYENDEIFVDSRVVKVHCRGYDTL